MIRKKIISDSMNQFARFWEKVDIPDDIDDCWEWLGTKSSGGYGGFRYNKIMVGAHRASWMINVGEIPDGMWICHHCDNPSCVNPNHLFLGNRQDNVDDRENKGRNKLPRCKGEDHGISKLTEFQVKEIRDLYASGGYSYRKLAKMYGVSFGNIRKIIKKQTWEWL